MSVDTALAWPLPRPNQAHGRLGRLDRFDRLRISNRDRRIIALAHTRLGGASVDFGEALRVLRDAVEELIPAGRTFLLGTTEFGPIIGSIVSGVGIAAAPDDVLLVRVERNGRRTTLGSFRP